MYAWRGGDRIAMLTIVRQEGENIIHSQDAAALPALLADKERLFWLDLEAPTPDEFQLLRDVFQFHPLAVEDATRPHQRPKVDEYDGYFFAVANEVTLNLDESKSNAKGGDADDDVQARQLSLFLGDNYLVTIHIEPVSVVAALRDRCE